MSLDTYIYIKEQHSISLQTKQKSIQQEEKKNRLQPEYSSKIHRSYLPKI